MYIVIEVVLLDEMLSLLLKSLFFKIHLKYFNYSFKLSKWSFHSSLKTKRASAPSTVVGLLCVRNVKSSCGSLTDIYELSLAWRDDLNLSQLVFFKKKTELIGTTEEYSLNRNRKIELLDQCFNFSFTYRNRQVFGRHRHGTS